VMITLADFILDKFGGDSIGETRTNLEAYRARISQPSAAPVPGGRGRSTTAAAGGEAGSGGDD